jgi:plasmid stabilization system protein ParE
MARREIVFTLTAAKQRRAILEYWTKRNGSAKYAKKLIRISGEHLKVIAQFPESFRESEVSGVHESTMGHFSIYYRFTETRIIVMAFWDNRQDPKKLLDLIS